MIQNRDFISIDYFTRRELEWVLDRAAEMKRHRRDYADLLKNRTLALVFFNASLRTRSSFDIGMAELGGHTTTLNIGHEVWSLEVEEGAVMLGDKTEHVKDAARVLSRYADAIAIRSFPKMESWTHEKRDLTIITFQKYSDVPIINLESSLAHPCQAMADIMTIRERFQKPDRRRILLCWAYHPRMLPMAVPNSVVSFATRFGMDLTIAHPEGWELDDEIMSRARKTAEESGGSLRVTNDFPTAFEGQEIVYAKSWGSKNYYGRNAEELETRKPFRDWIVTTDRMRQTADGVFMHCLPVRRNVEVTDEVMDSPCNLAYEQAENRLHVQRAILTGILLGEQPGASPAEAREP
ncbi:MAG: N-acetylornithine carbamoyltransferase [Planctomycetes bacterium]|nr:N-acetylornithine carbamoyltransferase [Planctomycetota bacterium]